jgi:hypothetical protein
MAAIDRHAKVRASGDARTVDQRRADSLATLVLAGRGVRLNGTQGIDVEGGPAEPGGVVRLSGTQRIDVEGEPAASGGGVRLSGTQRINVEGGSAEPGGVVRLSGTQSIDIGGPVEPSVGASGADSPNAPAALVHVVVGVGTLLGSDEQPAELRGYGPITATQARALASSPGSVWRRLITAPDGVLLHVDPRTYRPTASVDRLVRLRDQVCAFPGCAMPARRCDIDHVESFDHDRPDAGGATIPANLQALCRRHHRLKTMRRWGVVRDADSGVATWTAPTGHVYTTRPQPYLTAA